MHLKIDPRGLPADGLHLEGQLPASFFDLAEKDPVRAVTPLTYQLVISRDEDDLLVDGTIAATFELMCGRCTEKFQYRVEVENYMFELTLENEDPIDLTTSLREDILLALPTYPRCETGNVAPRECPAEGKFNPETERDAAELDKAVDQNVWESLDQLSNLKRN